MKNDKMRVTELLSIGGSIASITGFSLIWLKETFDKVEPIKITFVFISILAISLISIGIISVIIKLLLYLYKDIPKDWKIPYWSFGSGIAIILTGLILMFIWQLPIIFIHMKY